MNIDVTKMQREEKPFLEMSKLHRMGPLEFMM